MQTFKDLLDSDRAYIFDGAMGTMLYSKGIYINRSYDELNLVAADLVREVHSEYVRAGADIIETNTFGANVNKLQPYGLEGNAREINVKAARIAREAAGDRALVAGAVGPLGLRIEPYGPTSFDEARQMFSDQISALLEGGVDLFVLETFSDISELHQAIKAVQDLCDLPIVAQVTIQLDGNTLFGATPEVFTTQLTEWGADVIGLNCGVGPAIVLNAIEKMRALTDRKLSAQPNAGLPRDVGGRQIYMGSPEYMAEYSRRIIQAGAKFVGGCCGSTPAHIKMIADAIRQFHPRTQQVSVTEAVKVSVHELKPPDVTVVPAVERSNLARKIARGEFVTTVEVLPPKGCSPAKTLDAIRLLKDAGVDGVNIPDGPRAQTRMGAMATAVMVQQQIGIEAVLHYCCRDRNLLGMMSDILGAQALGLRNLLLITGDPPKMGPYPDATAVFDIDSIGLTNMANLMNHGLDLGGNPFGEPTKFTIGVGVNPGHLDLDYELRRLEWKGKAGAEYAITQPVFDAAVLEKFLEQIEDMHLPVIAGIWPLLSYRNAQFMNNEVPGVSVTDEVMERMRIANDKSKEHGLHEGITIARETLARVRNQVAGVQVSAPLGRVDLALEVFDGLKNRILSAGGS